MSKVMFPVIALLLAGCASMGQWRTLSIDSSSELAFSDSVRRLDQELPYSRRQMFRLALADIARTGVENADRTSEGSPKTYTDEDFRRDLEGLTYDGVIAVADRTGTPVSRLYFAGRRSRAVAAAGRDFNAAQAQQSFAGDDQFWPVSNAGAVLSDAWKEPGFSPGSYRYP